MGKNDFSYPTIIEERLIDCCMPQRPVEFLFSLATNRLNGWTEGYFSPEAAMGIVWFFFDRFGWILLSAINKMWAPRIILSFPSVIFFSISIKKAPFDIRVRHRLWSDFITDINFRPSHEESGSWFGNSLIIVIFPFLHLGQHKRSWPVSLCIISR